MRCGVIRRAVVGLVMVLLVSALPSEPAHAKSVDYQQLLEQLDQHSARISELHGQLDSAQYRADSVLLDTEFDADAIVGFVRDEIVYQPYAGLLRGVTGTLQTRAGNALDQSLLLAYLLNSAAFDARIVRGALTSDQARRLVLSLRESPAEQALGDIEAINASLTKWGVKPQAASLDLKDTKTYRRASEALNDLRAIAKRQQLPLASVDLTAELIKEATEYFWVQYRTGPGQKWLDLHPAWPGKAPRLKVVEYMKGSIPEKYHHTLKVEAFIAKRTGDEEQTLALMKPWKKPIANLVGVPITFFNSPSGLSLETASDPAAFVKQTAFFTPVFMGESGSQVFDLKGRLVDAMAAGPKGGGKAGIFQTFSDKMEQATGTLIDPDNPSAIFELQAQWLDFTFTEPGGKQYKQRRYILPPISAVQPRQAMDRILPLIGEWSFFVNPGDLSAAYLADRYLTGLQDSQPWLRVVVDKSFSPDGTAVVPSEPISMTFPLSAQYYLMDRAPLLPDGVIRYRAAPSLLGIQRGYKDLEHAFWAVDIVSNRQRFITIDQQRVMSQPEAAMAQGVWETAAEWLPGVVAEQRFDSLDTLVVMGQAAKQKIAVDYLAPAADLSNITNPALAADLAAGYAVVMPQQTPGDLALTGWWRIDPVTGETLGMMANGSGQSSIEYLIVLVDTSLGMVNAIGALQKCEKETDDAAKLCCLVNAHVKNVAGLAAGGLMGSVAGNLGGAVFSIAETTLGWATEDQASMVPAPQYDCSTLPPSDF